MRAPSSLTMTPGSIFKLPSRRALMTPVAASLRGPPGVAFDQQVLGQDVNDIAYRPSAKAT